MSSHFVSLALERLVHQSLRHAGYENPVVICGDCGRGHKEIFFGVGSEERVHAEIENMIKNVDGLLRTEYGN
jgi:hypothetical protein